MRARPLPDSAVEGSLALQRRQTPRVSRRNSRAKSQFPAIFLAEKALCDFLSKRTLSRADQCLDAGRLRILLVRQGR